MGVDRVIELRIQPIGRSVARRAIVRKIELYVGRILAVVKVGCMARVTSCGRALKDVVDVAGSAWQCRVRPREGKTGNAQVIELGVEPRVHSVAGLTGCWEAGRYMV